MNRVMLDLAARRLKRVMISLPPRHGKSFLASQHLPPWWLGTFPDERVMFASYNSSFAMRWGAKSRMVFGDVAPRLWGLQLADDSAAKDYWNVAKRTGGMMTGGYGSGFAGEGAHLAILDDLVKDAEVAASPTYLEKQWDWYQSIYRPRLEPGGVMLIVMTRWAEDDICGRLLKAAKAGAEQWLEIRLPALAEENDPLGRTPDTALWEARYSTDDLKMLRRSTLAYWWAALYQQRPAPLEGGQFKKQWFRYFRTNADGTIYTLLRPEGKKYVRAEDCWRFSTMDLAASLKEKADYTVISTWAVTPDKDLLLLDVLRDRLEGPDQITAIGQVLYRWNPSFIGIERVAYQLTAVQHARRKGWPVREMKADRDKLARSLPIATHYMNGKVFHPQTVMHDYVSLEWLPLYEAELLLFPNADHDDMVDTASNAGLVVNKGNNVLDATRERLEQLRQEQETEWTPYADPDDVY